MKEKHDNRLCVMRNWGKDYNTFLLERWEAFQQGEKAEEETQNLLRELACSKLNKETE